MRCLAAVPVLAGDETAVDTSGLIDLDEARLQRRHHLDALTGREGLEVFRGDIAGRTAIACFERAGGACKANHVDRHIVETADDAGGIAGAIG